MIYCVSDIHGELDKFERMLERINFCEADRLYIIGDVIDRGAMGVELLQKIMSAANMTMLLGNHEQMCLSTLGPHNEFGARELWRQNGGMPTYRKLLYRLTPGERHRILRFLSGLPDHLDLTVNGQNSTWSTAVPARTAAPASGAGWIRTLNPPRRTPSASWATPPPSI